MFRCGNKRAGRRHPCAHLSRPLAPVRRRPAARVEPSIESGTTVTTEPVPQGRSPGLSPRPPPGRGPRQDPRRGAGPDRLRRSTPAFARTGRRDRTGKRSSDQTAGPGNGPGACSLPVLRQRVRRLTSAAKSAEPSGTGRIPRSLALPGPLAPGSPFVGRSGEQPRPAAHTGPPSPPGFFSTEAGRSDPYSPVTGSMTRVEPPGPGTPPAPGLTRAAPTARPYSKGYGPASSLPAWLIFRC